MPAFSLPYCPGLLTVSLHPVWNALLLMLKHPAASVTDLAPEIFGAKVLDQ